MLNLSDVDLAKLRWDIWRVVLGSVSPLDEHGERNEQHVAAIVAWCLRDRETE